MNTERFSPIALAVLALLYETPMHPYRMQQLIKERGKDAVINVRQRARLYQTIDRLLRAKLIEVRETAREEKRPERTIYGITEQGRSTMLTWMRELLATPAREFPAFPAVLAHLTLLTPEDVRDQLSQRARALAAEIEGIEAELRMGMELVPRLFLLELEYLRAMTSTELSWVQSIVEELAAGRLTWNEEWLRAVAAQFERLMQPKNQQEE
jgi:DNA-binding PadR family transcriptional regulator